MATVSSLGLSGLPLTDLLQSLQKNENQVLAAIQERQKVAEDKVSSYGKLNDAIATFQKAAQAVGKTDTFGAIAAKTSSEAISASTTNKAIAGQYSIQVDTLASAQTLVYDGRGSRTDAIGTGGKITFTANGEEKTLDLTGKGTSLNDLVQAINSDPDLGINATIVNNGTEGSQYQLLLTNRETGTDAAVTNIQVEGNAELQAFLGYDSADNTNAGLSVSEATNAALSINGIAITSQSNTVANVIDGVTLTLNQTTTDGPPASLTLTQDPSVAKSAIEEFVKAYNSLQSSIKSQTAYDIDKQESAPLTGDSITRSIQSRMRDAISGAFDPSNRGTNLSQMGITTDPKTGHLLIDDAKLDKALADNTEGVKSIFTSETGIAARVGVVADNFIRADGTLTLAKEGMSKTVTDIEKQFKATSERIDQRMETYRNQFTQLDAMVTQMNSLSSYLSQQLSALNATTNVNK